MFKFTCQMREGLFWAFLIFSGGVGATATVVFMGYPVSTLFFGIEGYHTLPFIPALLGAVVFGLLLGIGDEYMTKKLYTWWKTNQKVQHEKTNVIQTPANTGELIVSFFLSTLGEEGLRGGLIFLLTKFLSVNLIVITILVGIGIGMSHGIYGIYAIPTKIIDSLILSFVLVFFGLIVSFILHFTLNFYMLFDVRFDK